MRRKPPSGRTRKLLAERLVDLRKSEEFFRSENKTSRERWVAEALLGNANVAFDPGSVKSSDEDPPDVMFEDARFEVKEILDKGRKRHSEYKDAIKGVSQARSTAELLVPFQPKDIYPEEVGALLKDALAELESKYPSELRRTLDALFYVNLKDHFLCVGPMPSAEEFARFGWRSVSAVCGQSALVFSAPEPAPQFLRARQGKLEIRSQSGA
jgi:hypothetical protein